jgi:hypothetical protein
MAHMQPPLSAYAVAKAGSVGYRENSQPVHNMVVRVLVPLEVDLEADAQDNRYRPS